MNRLVIGIVVWNNADDAIRCAESLLHQLDKKFTILFVNNSSTDESVEGTLQDYINNKSTKQLVYIETNSNRGTAGGFNAILSWAREHEYTYAGTLNADATAKTDWVLALIEELEKFNCVIATGQLIHMSTNTVDTTGELYTVWGLPGPRLRDELTSKAPQKAGEVFGATGGGFIAKTSLFDDIGLFDEAFFMYYEDVDMSFRAQLAGHKIRYTPKAIAYHKRGASSDTVPGLATYNTFKNLPLLFWKNVPLGLFPTIAPRFFVAYHLILGNAIVRGKGIPALKGWAISLILLPRSLVLRQKIQSSKKVSTSYIKSIILHDIPPDQTGLRKFRKFFTGKA
jgi:GT2 family glycosyltransferase